MQLEQHPATGESILDAPEQALKSKNQHNHYPTLARRYKAVFIDSMIIFAVLIIVMVVIGERENSTSVMIIVAVILLLGYEAPLTVYSKTLGQRMMKIKVIRHSNNHERIPLFNAYFRMIIKLALGWISFLTVSFNPEHRAIHDLMSDSVMVIDE